MHVLAYSHKNYTYTHFILEFSYCTGYQKFFHKIQLGKEEEKHVTTKYYTNKNLL